MLTSQDIKIIQGIIHASEISITRNVTREVINNVTDNVSNSLTKIMDNKIDRFASQILDYTNTLRDTHEDILRNHESRINKIEKQNILK